MVAKWLRVLVFLLETRVRYILKKKPIPDLVDVVRGFVVSSVEEMSRIRCTSIENGVFVSERLVRFFDAERQVVEVLVDSKNIEDEYLRVKRVGGEFRRMARGDVLVELPTEDSERVWIRDEDFFGSSTEGDGNDSQ